MPLQRGYRRVEADYAEFQRDCGELNVMLNPARIMGALRAFGDSNGLEFDFDLLGSVPASLS